jgi:hypothetical protein
MEKAKIKRTTLDWRLTVQCGKCGQRMCMLEVDERTGKPKLEAPSDGHRYDEREKMWYPTETYRRKYSAASDRILRNRERDGDRQAVRAAYGFEGRRGRLEMWDWTNKYKVPSGAFWLPVKFVCVRCGEVNEVELHSD